MWRRRRRREGGGHQPRDGRLEPPEAGRGGEDPPLEPLQEAQRWDPLTSDVWSPGLGEDGCPGLWAFLTAVPGNSRRYLQPARVRVAMSDVG